MPIEVSCGQCSGRMLVEAAGVVVACPHCGAHVSVPLGPLPFGPGGQVDGGAPGSMASGDGLNQSDSLHLTFPATHASVQDVDGPMVSHSSPDMSWMFRGSSTEAALESSLGQTSPESPASSNPEALSGLVGASFPEPASVPDNSAEGAAPPLETPPLNPVVDATVESSSPDFGSDAAVPPMASATPASEAAPTISVAEVSAEEVPESDQPPANAGVITTDAAAGATPAENELDEAWSVPTAKPSNLTANIGLFNYDSSGDSVTGTAHATDVAGASGPGSMDAASAPVAPSGTWMPAPPPQAGNGPFEAPSAAPGVMDTATNTPTGVAIDAGSNPNDPPMDEPASARPAGRSSMPLPGDVVPRQWFMSAVSYAALVTLVMIYLLYTRYAAQPHRLESLPDIVPKITGSKGQLGHEVAAPAANVAPGHRLRLGMSERYGSLRVTPVKVTLGPIGFESAIDADGPARDASPPVLKLWLKFENVSPDQSFPPLGPELLFRRKYDQRFPYVLTNNFLGTEAARLKNGPLTGVYDLPVVSEFRIVDQQADHVISPGETWETFIPSEEGIETLCDAQEELVWRVQFRKGYNRESHWGVTTLIDVLFQASDIAREEPVANEAVTG